MTDRRVTTDLEPLSSRVPHHDGVAPPAAVEGIDWRPATLDDVDGIHAVVRAVGLLEHPHFTVPREEVLEDLEAEWTDLERDTIVAVDAGRIAGWGVALRYPGQETILKSIALGSVHPEHRRRGIGRAIAAWQVRRGEQQLSQLDTRVPGWIQTFQRELGTAARSTLEHAGFRVARWFVEMTRDLGEPVARREAAGIRIVPFSSELSEPTRVARDDAFRDHWGSQPSTPAIWAKGVGRSIFRADLSRVALAEDGAVAGFLLAEVNPEDTEATGVATAYYSLIGTARAHRGRGVASAVIAEALVAAREAGLERAALDVDSDSPTGALGLYERHGFAAAHRSLSMTIEY